MVCRDVPHIPCKMLALWCWPCTFNRVGFRIRNRHIPLGKHKLVSSHFLCCICNQRDRQVYCKFREWHGRKARPLFALCKSRTAVSIERAVHCSSNFGDKVPSGFPFEREHHFLLVKVICPVVFSLPMVQIRLRYALILTGPIKFQPSPNNDHHHWGHWHHSFFFPVVFAIFCKVYPKSWNPKPSPHSLQALQAFPAPRIEPSCQLLAWWGLIQSGKPQFWYVLSVLHFCGDRSAITCQSILQFGVWLHWSSLDSW